MQESLEHVGDPPEPWRTSRSWRALDTSSMGGVCKDTILRDCTTLNSKLSTIHGIGWAEGESGALGSAPVRVLKGAAVRVLLMILASGLGLLHWPRVMQRLVVCGGTLKRTAVGLVLLGECLVTGLGCGRGFKLV